MVKFSFAALFFLFSAAVYGEETLLRSAVIDSALEKNLAYRAAQEESRSSYYRYMASWGSYLPTVDLGYRYTDTNSSNALNNASQARSSYTAEANINLFHGFRYYMNNRALRSNYKGALEDELAVRLSTKMDTSLAFQNALKSLYVLKTAAASLENAELVLNETKLRVKLGSISNLDLYRAQADREKAYSDYLDAELNHLNILQEISRLSGLSISKDIKLVDDAPPFKLKQEAEYIEDALKYNTAIAKGCYLSKAADYTYNENRGSFLPTVSASAGTGWYEPERGGDYNSNYIGVSATWNIFSGFSDFYQTLSASKTRNSTRLNAVNTRNDVMHNITIAYRRADVNDKKLKSSTAYVKAADEAYKVTQEMFRLGRAPLKDVVDARISLQEAQSQLADAEYQLAASYEELEYLTGGNSPRESYTESCE
ncbi:MAG: TolC family protein [Deferribacteraceae bacterium]|nr:TolC family protein [Deferribacteraceae bacterium]